VSDVRQVPDHQEVFQDLSSAEQPCLIVEILQYHREQPDDKIARYLFQDLAEANASLETHFMSQSQPIVPTGTDGHVVTICSGCGYQMIAMGRDFDIHGQSRRDRQEIRWVKVELCVLRLPEVTTDLLVTLSSTVQGPPPPQATDTFSVAFTGALSTLQIRDWTLFGG
jgi:hypothetical protein